MARRSARSYRVQNIASIATSITGRKTLISLPASASGACKSSSRRGAPNDFSPRVVPSPNLSSLDATGSRLPPIARRWVTESRSGGRSQGWLLPHKRQAEWSAPPLGLLMASNHVNLTMPFWPTCLTSCWGGCPVRIKSACTLTALSCSTVSGERSLETRRSLLPMALGLILTPAGMRLLPLRPTRSCRSPGSPAQDPSSQPIAQCAPTSGCATSQLPAVYVISENFGFAGEELDGPQPRVRFSPPGFVREPVIVLTAELL
jgi:hypothetical protein